MDTKSVKEDIRKAEAAINPNQTREVPGAYDQAEREADEAEHERIISDIRGESELSFAEQVDKALNNQFARYDNSDLKLSNTPDILLKIGCEQLPILYTRNHLKEAIRPKNEHTHTHGLSTDLIKQIPIELEKPVMVFDSQSRNDSIVVVTSLTDSDNLPIIVSIKPNGHGVYELQNVDSNFATSIYGREGFESMLERVIANNDVLYCDQQKSQDLFSVLGLQSSEGFNNLDFNIIIHQSRNISRENQDISSDIFADEDIDKAKGFISDYLYSKFGKDTPDFNDLSSIGLAYTTIDNADFLKEAGVTDYEKEFEIQVDANLIDKEVITYIDGDELFTEKFDSMEEMNDYLEMLDFNDLIYIGDVGWQKIADREIDREAAVAIDTHEAEFGADGSRVFPRLNETKEETLAGQIDRFMSLSMPEYDYSIDRQNNIEQLTSFLENGHYDEVKRIFNDVIRHGNAETPELEEMALNLSAQVNDLEKGKEHTLPLPEQNIQEELDAIFDNSKGVRQGRGREPQADAGSPKERLDSADKINAAELTGDYDRMVSYLATGKIKEPKITLTKTAEQDRITASASSKNVSEPFNAKDGNKYVRIMIPNKDRHDDSPWASIVVKPEQVSDAGKGIKSIDFRANGTVTVYKGNRQPDGSFINAKFKLSTTEVKEWLDKTAPKNIMKDIPVKKEKSKELKEQHKQEQNKTKSADKNRTGDGIE